jgi:flagellar basal body-associated protein FliL
MSEEAVESPSGSKPPKKSKLGIVLAIVAVVLLVAGAAVAGTLLGPELLSGGKKAESAHEKSDAAHAEESSGEKVGEVTELSPILVDTRGADGSLHHLKVVLSVELDETTPKAEFMKYAPRGREVAVAYLRSQPFEVVSASDRYEEVRKELSERFSKAIEPAKVGRVLIVDFVAQ